MKTGMSSEISTAYNAISHIRYALNEWNISDGNGTANKASLGNDEENKVSLRSFIVDNVEDICDNNSSDNGNQGTGNKDSHEGKSRQERPEPAIMLNGKEREKADCFFVINYQSASGWGMCPMNKIYQWERVIVVLNEELYHFRGPDPNDMTRWEYYNGTRIVKQL